MHVSWLQIQGRRPHHLVGGFPSCSVIKNLPANVGSASLIPGWEDPLEEGMETHSSIPDWETLWPEEAAGYSSRDRKDTI